MGVKDAGGEQVQHKFAMLVDDGVTGIAAALKAHHDIGCLRKVVGGLAFTFVSPIGAHDCGD